ncbi:hypothetical protein GCM10027347_02440 [Larkinella harenae]
MEKHHKQRLLEKFPDETLGKSIVVLNITDDYAYMDEELINAIKNTVSIYLHDEPMD